jgi:hypothetical protein
VGPLYPEQHTPTRAIQRRAARFAYNNFYDREPGVVTSMISRLQWESLERRAKARATFMYKIVNNLVDVHAEHILTTSDNRTRGNQLKSELNVTISVLYHECHSGQVSLVVVYVEPCQRLSKR